MSKNDEPKKTTTRISASLLPEDFGNFTQDGFSQIATVLIGDPKNESGKTPYFLGILNATGTPIEMEETVNGVTIARKRRTWVFHPIIKLPDGDFGIERNITQIVPGDYNLDAAFGRILDRANSLQTEAIVGVIYLGKGRTRKDRPINQYDIRERYIGHEPKREIQRISMARALPEASDRPALPPVGKS